MKRLKSVITAAYKEVLVPYLLGQVENYLDCENAPEIHMLFVDLHQRMLEFRDKDTSKMERKLKKEQNPRIVLQLFNLKSLEK